jgi:hypothetical protein
MGCAEADHAAWDRDVIMIITALDIWLSIVLLVISLCAAARPLPTGEM